MSATIPSPQLQAITRLELGAIALNKALRAVQHPDLEFGGGALVAPPGIKHLSEIRATLDDIERAVHSSAPKASTPESAAVAYDRQRAELAASVVAAWSAVDTALKLFEHSERLLAQLPDEAPAGEDDGEIVALACGCRAESGDLRITRLTRGTWRTLVGACSTCGSQILER